jgi:hypothetical protein
MRLRVWLVRTGIAGTLLLVSAFGGGWKWDLPLS